MAQFYVYVVSMNMKLHGHDIWFHTNGKNLTSTD